MPIDALEKKVNSVTDKDGAWWPFLWLRPHKHVSLTLDRLCMLAVLYGAPGGMLLAVGFALLYPSQREKAALVALGFPMLLLFIATAIIGPMWNRRAERLRRRLRD